MNQWIWMILLQIVLIALNAVFAGSEIAILSVNDYKLKKLKAEGNKSAARLEKLTKEPSKVLSTIQIAITLSGFLGSAFAADNFSGAMANWLLSLGLPFSYNALESFSVIVITIILSYFTLVFGELVPKQIALHKSEQMALSLSGLISGIAKIFSPLVKVLTWSTNAVLRLFGISPDAQEEAASEEEIIMMISDSEEKGSIDASEKELINNVFAFDDLEANDLMTHRTRITALDLDKPDTWMDVILGSERSVIPAYRASMDNMEGVLNTKKFFRQPAELSLEERLTRSLQPPYYVWESMKADDLFSQMKRDKQNMAIVLDEYGGVSGLITLSDLVRELVGEYEDEQPEIERLPDGSFKVQGRAGITDLARALQIDLDADLVTFNGLVYHLLQSVPDNGAKTIIPFGTYEIELKDVRNHRVEEALIRPVTKQAAK